MLTDWSAFALTSVKPNGAAGQKLKIICPPTLTPWLA